MKQWPNPNFLKRLGIELPIIQAPMAGADSIELATEVSEAGGLGSLGCALLTTDQIRQSFIEIRKRTKRPVNLNFFCHADPQKSAEKEALWKKHLEPFYRELGIDPSEESPSQARAPFTAELCSLLEELKPRVVSFHFGLPEASLVQRLKALGTLILSSATSVREAVWLEKHGCDAVIAQGFEAGGHRGMFLETEISMQIGTMALVPQVVDAVRVPVIAAGGIADARGISASFALGASAVQLGTAYLFCPEAKISPLHRQALKKSHDHPTVLTNVFSGRPARGILNRLIKEAGPMSPQAPQFPLASTAVAPLRKQSEAQGTTEFMQLWSGQSAALAQEMPARRLTQWLAEQSGWRTQ
jgi:nitronate monooxygenase